MEKIKTYRVRGEYGIQAGDLVEHVIRAKSLEAAWKRGVKLLKQDPRWGSIGTHNMYVIEITE